jgi:hypothetical protein
LVAIPFESSASDNEDEKGAEPDVVTAREVGEAAGDVGEAHA